jgi:hypothetical protein
MTIFPEYSHGELLCWGAHFSTNVCLQDPLLFDSLKHAIYDAFATVERWDLRVKRCLVIKKGHEYSITAFHGPVQVELDPATDTQATICVNGCQECGNIGHHLLECKTGLVEEIMEI